MFWKIKTGKCVSNCTSGSCLHYEPGYLNTYYDHDDGNSMCVTQERAKDLCYEAHNETHSPTAWCNPGSSEVGSIGKCVSSCSNECGNKNVLEVSPSGEVNRCISLSAFTCRHSHTYTVSYWTKGKERDYGSDTCNKCRAEFVKMGGCEA